MQGNFGARPARHGMTEFRLWAPNIEQAGVSIGNQGIYPMEKTAGGTFSVTLPVPAGTRYRFQISPTQSVPDPASRAQAGDVDDDSIVVDPSFNWIHQDWRGRPWSETVIYEVHAGAFGGFTGISKQLARLAALGITAIELMPIAEFPGRQSWGYDGVLHYAPDASYGTPNELKELIDAAHGHGLMVFLDVVYNHFGPAGNYLPSYAAKFFRDDLSTPWGSAIDFQNPEVRRFYIENALYWLGDYRFDGLRFDAVSMIKDPSFLFQLATELRSTFEPARHIHLMVENEHNEAALLECHASGHLFDAQWTDDWHHSMHVLLTGESEGYYEDFQKPAEQLARCLQEGFCYQGEFSPHGGSERGTESKHLAPTSFLIFLQNHDQIGNRAFGDRLTTIARPESLRAATALLLMTPQIPLIFMGDEWGETKPFLFFADHEEPLAEMVREGRRREFRHFAAFADLEQREKIADPNAFATFSKSIPEMPIEPTDDQRLLIELYRDALRLRHAQIVPRITGAVSTGACSLGARAVRASWKMGDGAELTVAGNFGEFEVPCVAGPGKLLLTTSKTIAPLNALPGFCASVWLDLPSRPF